MKAPAGRFVLSLLAALALSASPALPAGEEFSLRNADAILREIALGIGPRPMGSPAERRALDFAVGEFRRYGCDTAYVMAMDRTRTVNTSSGIAIGVKKGRTGRVILLGGHIDSAGPEIPGANDDGSGCAVVLEAARALSGDDTESTIVFALFGGEEQGLQGSRYFVEHFAGIDSVDLMIQTDMANGLGTITLDPDAYGGSAPPWLVRAAVEEFSDLGYTGLDYPFHYFSWNYALEDGSGSDHEPFLQAGIPAIDFTTDVGDPIHTPQDSYENFEPAGLKRSGDLVLRLVRRFDGGVPSRSTSDYLLCLVFGTPLFVPIWGVWIFIVATMAAAALLLLRLRKTHLTLPPGYVELAKRRWPALKLLLISLVTVVPAWFSSDLIGLLKNVRYPWFAHPGSYYLLALFASVFGILTGLRVGGALGISRSPYVLFKRSAIALTVLTAAAALVGPKVAVAPAACLLLLTLSLVIPFRPAAGVIALLSPYWMFRLIFSEADTLLFRFAAPAIPGTVTAGILVNGIWIAVLTLLVFAWLPGFVAMVRIHGKSGRLLGVVRSRRFLVITAGLFGIYSVYLVLLPSYEPPWYPDLRVENLAGSGSDTVRVRSSEYLKGAEILFAGTDTTISDNATQFVSAGSGRAAGPWLRLFREIRPTVTDSGTNYDVLLRIGTSFRPYTLNVTYESSRGTPPPVSTPLRSRTRGEGTAISWYSFPDTAIVVPVGFTVREGDTLRETIEATFDSLAIPVEVHYRKANLTRRTVWREVHSYAGGG